MPQITATPGMQQIAATPGMQQIASTPGMQQIAATVPVCNKACHTPGVQQSPVWFCGGVCCSPTECALDVSRTECALCVRRRYHIEVIGRRRMRLRSTSDLDGYRIAQVSCSHSRRRPAFAARPSATVSLPGRPFLIGCSWHSFPGIPFLIGFLG
eukprot:365187-Chlamydomonas_euryale.AAC.19